MAHRPRRSILSSERGVALVAVLLVLSLLLAVVGEFAFVMRLEAVTTANFRAAITSVYLAEAGYHRAVAEILPDAQAHQLDERGWLVFRRDGSPPAAPTRTDIPLGPGSFTYRITDEESRININRAPAPLLHRLLAEFDVERRTRDVIVDSILDWRDANETHRLNGAESAYYETLAVPYRSKNRPFDTVQELLQVRGVTAEMFYGSAERPGLIAYVTAAGTGAININTVTAPVLRALGYSTAEADLLIARRPYADMSAVGAQLRRRNQRTRSDTFRIEASGDVPGQGRRGLVAVVRRKVESEGLAEVTPLEWRWRSDDEGGRE